MPQHIQGSAYEEGRWSLDDLFPATSGPEIEQAFADVQAAADAIEARQSALVPEIEEAAFVEILEWIVKLTYVTDKLDGFAVLSFFANTEDQKALALRGRVDTLQADARNRALRFELWWKALDEENARRLLKAAGDNAYYLRTLRRFAPYTLSEVEERIVNVKNVNGAAGLAKLYTMITSNLTFDFESDGESIELTRSELMDSRGTSRRSDGRPPSGPFSRCTKHVAQNSARSTSASSTTGTQRRSRFAVSLPPSRFGISTTTSRRSSSRHCSRPAATTPPCTSGTSG